MNDDNTHVTGNGSRLMEDQRGRYGGLFSLTEAATRGSFGVGRSFLSSHIPSCLPSSGFETNNVIVHRIGCTTLCCGPLCGEWHGDFNEL